MCGQSLCASEMDYINTVSPSLSLSHLLMYTTIMSSSSVEQLQFVAEFFRNQETSSLLQLSLQDPMCPHLGDVIFVTVSQSRFSVHM